MTVIEYREEQSALLQAMTSLKSAATDPERIREGQWVRHAMKCLIVSADKCRRLKESDRVYTNLLVAEARELLARGGLSLLLDRMEAADVNLQRMAFAGEYR